MFKWAPFGDRQKKSPATVKSADEQLYNHIQKRAYLLWEADGSPEGKSEYYWSKAVEESAHEYYLSPRLFQRLGVHAKSVAGWVNRFGGKLIRKRKFLPKS